MDQIELSYFKNLFRDMLKNIEVGKVKLEKRGGDSIDIVNDERDNNMVLKMQGRKQFYSKKISQAMVRIDDGSFGYCQDCEGSIEKRRLMARPMATRCISCKEEQERDEKHIPYEKRSHTTGRKISGNVIALKINNEEILKEGNLKLKSESEMLGISVGG